MKRLLILLLILALPLTMGAAGTEPTEEPAAEDPAVQAALEQYRTIAAQADTYQYDPYGFAVPTGNYQYALVRLTPDDAVPTLLLSQETEDYTCYVRLFRYDPETDTVQAPEEPLTEVTAQEGGERIGLSMSGDGNGLHTQSLMAMTGEFTIFRITIDEDGQLKTEEAWSGRIDAVPEDITSTKIEWYDIEDAEALESWTPEEATGPADGDVPEDTGPLPEDGDRLVLQGTLNEYSYDETVALQGQPDPNAQYTDHSQTFWLIVLDEPQTLELWAFDGPGYYRSGDVALIGLTDPTGLEQYAGQHVTFSIDPAVTLWPSDSSMPLGQPRTSDVHILN